MSAIMDLETPRNHQATYHGATVSGSECNLTATFQNPQGGPLPLTHWEAALHFLLTENDLDDIALHPKESPAAPGQSTQARTPEAQITVDPRIYPDRDRYVETVIDTLKKLWPQWGGRVEDILRRALCIIHEHNSHPDTSPEQYLNFQDIPSILETKTSADGLTGQQEAILQRVRTPQLHEWLKIYMKWPHHMRMQATEPILERFREIRNPQDPPQETNFRLRKLSEGRYTGTGKTLRKGTRTPIATIDVSLQVKESQPKNA